ncbi:ricin-type beta-trefoil lectin domain protein [Actinocorallia aurea]
MVAAITAVATFVAVETISPSPAEAAENPTGQFTPLWETPVLGNTTVPANGKIEVPVLGQGGIPASGVSAASLAYTVRNITEFGWLEVYPTDQAAPNLSTLSFYPGEPVTNADYTRLGASGKVYIANHSNSPITVSVTTDGYFADGVVTGTIVSRNGGRCADAAGNSSADGTAIQLYDCIPGHGAQQITLAADGTLRIFGKCIDITAGDFNNGTKLQLYTCNGSPAQQWVPHYGDGTIVNPGSGRCFDAAANGTVNGTLLQIWDCNGSAGQYWDIPQAAGGKTAYQPLPTDTVFDTRFGTGVPSRTTPIAANSALTFDVHGRVGIPSTAAEAGAVALNVLATGQTADGTLGLHPSDAPASSSVLAFNTDETNSVFTIAQMSGTGKLTIENNSAGTVHVSVTVRGYFTWANTGDAATYRPAKNTPLMLDTLAGIGTGGGNTAAIEPYASITFKAIESSVIAPAVAAVALNINVRRGTAKGWLSVSSAGEEDPGLSSVNWDAEESTSGFDTTIADDDGYVTFYNRSSGTVHLQVSTRGYFMYDLSDYSATPPTEEEDGEVLDPVTGEDSEVSESVDAGRGTYAVKCTMTVESPHWSKLYKGVIYKNRVTCTGWGRTSVSVYVTGNLSYVYGGSKGNCAAGPATTVARSKQSQQVPVNGGPKTFYTPLSKKVTAAGTYYGSSTFQITSPQRTSIKTVKPKCAYAKAP